MTISQPKPDELPAKTAIAGESHRKPVCGWLMRVPAELRDQAIQRLVGTGSQMDSQHARRFMEYAGDHRIRLDGLWARMDQNGQIQFTVLAVPNPGRTAMMFASHPHSRDQTAAIGELIDHACSELASFDVDLAQVLVDPAEPLEQEAFTAGGFRKLASLSYLERSLRRPRMGSDCAPSWPDGVKPVRYTDAMRDDLIAILDASYVHTLDCPGLRGYRRTEDILEGHRASGVFDPSLWTILLIDGKPGGTLLLNPGADRQSVELVYLGLAPWARGRGLGQLLLRHGLALLNGRQERTVTLAVDEANAPALAVYRHEGFVPVLRRIAMIRPLREIATSSPAEKHDERR
jgi:mycothiol synthase